MSYLHICVYKSIYTYTYAYACTYRRMCEHVPASCPWNHPRHRRLPSSCRRIPNSLPCVPADKTSARKRMRHTRAFIVCIMSNQIYAYVQYIPRYLHACHRHIGDFTIHFHNLGASQQRERCQRLFLLLLTHKRVNTHTRTQQQIQHLIEGNHALEVGAAPLDDLLKPRTALGAR